VRVTSLEQLRLLPEEDLVEALRTRSEDQWFDRKGPRIQPRQLAEAMIGFANAEGGLIAVGFDGELVEGTRANPGRVNGWRQSALDHTDPPVRHRFQVVTCLNTREEPDEIVVIEVEASDRVHETARGEVFLRVGDENRRLGPREAQELRYDKGDSVFDGTAADGSGIDDLDPERVDRYLRRVRAGSADATSVLQARGLLVRGRRAPSPSVAGVLVLGREPQGSFPQATLRILRYRGTSRETGARSNIQGDRRFDGPLPLQIEAATRQMRRWLPKVIRLGPEGRFSNVTLIPTFAWLEAIVNGLVHRSYSVGGDHVRVEIFPDRLEIESPGRLPGLVRTDNIRAAHFARNPRVARAMSDLGYGRELGEGVDRMFHEMQSVGLPDPIYRQGPASVTVVLLADALSKRILERLPTGSERFVEHLSRAGRVTTTEAVDLFQVSRPTALRYLHELAEAGLVEHTGTSLKDPRGFWRLRRGGTG
jgi:ATP-dependent DNA helicase RecG